ncbi:MAG: barnase inhibitor [Burkholderiales bacterium]|nr:MAG: barnase inhibitor [Burkholderiales bacterium]
MTPLESLPPNAVEPLADRKVAALRRLARASGQRFLHADCADARDKAGVMSALARGFGLPAHFGANLDALYDCLTDLEPEPGASAPGLVLVVEHLPRAPGFGDEARDALLEVFRDAADGFAERGVAFRAFWSLSGARRAPP